MASELLVRKRRNDLDEDLKVTIKKGKHFLKQLVKDRRRGKRAISPKTEKAARDILQRWEAQEEDSDSTDKIKSVRETKRRLQEMQRKVEMDEAFQSARLKLEELTNMQCRLQYGVYLASYASFTSQEARDL